VQVLMLLFLKQPKILKRKGTLQKELNRITDIIINKYEPEKIILFGSLSSGNIHEWSDIDLAIIKETKKRFIERLHEVSLLTLPRLGVNFIVYTPEEFQDMIAKRQYFVVDEIMKKGKIVYEHGK